MGGRGHRLASRQVAGVGVLSRLLRALDELNIRPVQKEFTARQWKLMSLIDDAGVYQDFTGEHTKIAEHDVVTRTRA